MDDGPFRRLDDPQNAPFLEEPVKQRSSFQGLGRSLGSSNSTPSAASEPTPAAATATASLDTAPLPSRGLVLDESLPLTSIQLRLADGNRMVSRFNHYHTVRDIHMFIDVSRPGGPTSYQLHVMGFPPKQLTDLDQTIEQAGIANSVEIQRL